MHWDVGVVSKKSDKNCEEEKSFPSDIDLNFCGALTMYTPVTVGIHSVLLLFSVVFITDNVLPFRHG